MAQPTDTESTPTWHRWLSTIIVVAASVVGAVMLLGFSLSQLFTGRALPVDEEGPERWVVVSADILVANLDGYVLRTDGERFRKTKYVNNRYELEYTYDQDDVASATHIFFEDDVEDARAMYLRQRRNLHSRITSHGESARTNNLSSMVPWGDEYTFNLVTAGGLVEGAYYVARRETKVFVFWLEGVDFKNSDVLAEEIRRRLTQLETYEP